MGTRLMLSRRIKQFWQGVRQLSGDDAYERYLRHYVQCHQNEIGEPPLRKAEFFKQWQDRQWRGINRCC